MWNELPKVVRAAIVTGFTILAAAVLWFVESYAGIWEAITK